MTCWPIYRLQHTATLPAHAAGVTPQLHKDAARCRAAGRVPLVASTHGCTMPVATMCLMRLEPSPPPLLLPLPLPLLLLPALSHPLRLFFAPPLPAGGFCAAACCPTGPSRSSAAAARKEEHVMACDRALAR